MPNEEPEFDPFAHDVKKRKAGGTGVASLALLLALAAAGFSGYQWWTARSQIVDDNGQSQEIEVLRRAHSELQQSLEGVRSQLQASAQKNNSAALAAVESGIQGVTDRVSELELSEAGDEALLDAVQNAMSSLHERLNGLDTSVSALARRGETPGKKLDLAEVDYLLRLASERLGLFGDVRSADHALELAQTHLEALNDPLYLPVRRRIETARQSLAEVPSLDMVEISGRISSLQTDISAFPFPGEAREDPTPVVASEPGVWQRIKNALTPLVKVRRRVDERTLLSLEDKDYLRQGLWLQLETARLALMRRDVSNWSRSLARAAETLQGRFDTGSQSVQLAIGTIEALMALPMLAELPDISAPWSQLRLLREGQATGRKPPVVLPGESATNAETIQAADAGETQASPPEEAPETDNPEETAEDDTGQAQPADGGGTGA